MYWRRGWILVAYQYNPSKNEVRRTKNENGMILPYGRKYRYAMLATMSRKIVDRVFGFLKLNLAMG
jgi:hypothetical protein